MAIQVRAALIGALALGAGAVIFATVGLTPSLRWVPEVPLLAAAVLYPAAVCGLVGYSAATGRPSREGALAGAVAGAAGGIVAGLCYVFYGKPTLNVFGGLLAGILGGALTGWAGALVGRWRSQG